MDCFFLTLFSSSLQSDVDWLKHSDLVLKEMLGISVDVTRYLTLPNSTKARHKVTSQGRKEAQNTEAVAARLNKSIVLRFSRLSKLCELIKREGLPSNEASRIRQWEKQALEYIEKLRVVKNYRTPQALRSFSRLFSLFLPPFYAPYYAQMAHELNSLGTAIAFSVITSLALTSLFEAASQMEDPFVHSVLDCIHIKFLLIGELAPQLLALRRSFFPQAVDFDDLPKGAEMDASPATTTGALAPIRMFSE
jgi:hypothetical protein